MQLVYDVAFVQRHGDMPTGSEWEGFMETQKRTLNAYAENGWKLATAVPVIRSTIEGATLAGILMYFTPQETG